jgi:hypothetical protein
MKKEVVMVGAETDSCRPIEMIRFVVNPVLYVIALIMYRFKDIELKMSSTKCLFRNQQEVYLSDILYSSIFGAFARKIAKHVCWLSHVFLPSARNKNC